MDNPPGQIADSAAPSKQHPTSLSPQFRAWWTVWLGPVVSFLGAGLVYVGRGWEPARRESQGRREVGSAVYRCSATH